MHASVVLSAAITIQLPFKISIFTISLRIPADFYEIFYRIFLSILTSIDFLLFSIKTNTFLPAKKWHATLGRKIIKTALLLMQQATSPHIFSSFLFFSLLPSSRVLISIAWICFHSHCKATCNNGVGGISVAKEFTPQEHHPLN